MGIDSALVVHCCVRCLGIEQKHVQLVHHFGINNTWVLK